MTQSSGFLLPLSVAVSTDHVLIVRRTLVTNCLLENLAHIRAIRLKIQHTWHVGRATNSVENCLSCGATSSVLCRMNAVTRFTQLATWSPVHFQHRLLALSLEWLQQDQDVNKPILLQPDYDSRRVNHQLRGWGFWGRAAAHTHIPSP